MEVEEILHSLHIPPTFLRFLLPLSFLLGPSVINIYSLPFSSCATGWLNSTLFGYTESSCESS